MKSTESTISFWFVVDVSGSIYGQKIAAVNAVLAECLNELKSIDSMADCTVRMGIITFSEKMKVRSKGESVRSITLPRLVVEKGADGFYSLTSYACLYQGLASVLKQLSLAKEHKSRAYLFLLTDGKPADMGEYAEELEFAKNCSEYKNASRYVALVNDDLETIGNDALCFVDYKADKIIKLSDLPREISKLKVTSFSSIDSNEEENALYDAIFQ